MVATGLNILDFRAYSNDPERAGKTNNITFIHLKSLYTIFSPILEVVPIN